MFRIYVPERLVCRLQWRGESSDHVRRVCWSTCVDSVTLSNTQEHLLREFLQRRRNIQPRPSNAQQANAIQPRPSNDQQADAIQPRPSNDQQADAIQPQPADNQQANAIQPQPADNQQADAIQPRPADNQQADAIQPRPMRRTRYRRNAAHNPYKR